MKSFADHIVVGVAAFALMMPMAWGQDFQRAYNLGSGARISIANVSGDIEVSGYAVPDVVVSAYREGRDRDRVEVEDRSDGGSVDLRVRYPENCNCDASVRFVVHVPQSVAYRFDALKTASGNIDLIGVAGEIEAKTASGNLTLARVRGTVSASTASGDVKVTETFGTVNVRTASGDVEVEIARLEGEGSLAFSSASGDVTVRLPPGLDADVQMSTASGRLHTDFPLTVEDRQTGRGRRASGRLGSGRHPLKISSASGNVSLRVY